MSQNNIENKISVSSLKAMFEEKIQRLQNEKLFQLPIHEEPEPDELPEQNLPTRSYKNEIKPWIKEEIRFLKRKILQINREKIKRNRYLDNIRTHTGIPQSESKAEELSSSYLNELEKIEYLLNEMNELLYLINIHEMNIKSVFIDKMTAATFLKQRIRLNDQYNIKKNILKQSIDNSLIILKDTREEIRKDLVPKKSELSELFERLAKEKAERQAKKEQEISPPPPEDDDLPSIGEDDLPPPVDDTIPPETDNESLPPDVQSDDDLPPIDDEQPAPDYLTDDEPPIPDDDSEIDAPPSIQSSKSEEKLAPPDEDDFPPEDNVMDAPQAPSEDSDDLPPVIGDLSSSDDAPIPDGETDDTSTSPPDLPNTDDEPPMDTQSDGSADDLDDEIKFSVPTDTPEDVDFDIAPESSNENSVQKQSSILQKYTLSPSVIHTSKLKRIHIDISQNPHIKPLMKIIFLVKKYGRSSSLKRKRILELDWLSGYIQTWHGTKRKIKYSANRIEKIEKDIQHPKLIRIYFSETTTEKSRVSEYYFVSKYKRDRFYECIKSILNLQLCCPSMLPDGEENLESCIVDISGSFRFRSIDGEVGKSQGERSFVITSSPFENILVYCCTFALGIAPDEPRDLRSFIPFNKCDLYCISIQDDRTNWDAKGENAFLNYAKELIGREYVVVSFHQGLNNTTKLIIFARKRHLPKITNIKIESVPFSKSSISLLCSLTFNESQLLFINSVFPETNDNKIKLYEQTCSLKMGEKSLPLLAQYDQIFWMGDFKYQINMETSTATKLALNKDNIQELLEADSFKNALSEEDPIFPGFKESQISFLPTSMKPPAYSDRILWHSNFSKRISCEVYTSHSDMNSDRQIHNPVYAIFNLSTERTFASIFCPYPRCTVNIEHLSAYLSNLVVNKPFFLVNAPWIETPFLSQKLEKSNAPIWNIALPTLSTISNHAVYMNNQSLRVSLYDGTTLLGAVFASIEELKGGDTVSFTLFSTKGRDIGVIKLRIKIVHS